MAELYDMNHSGLVADVEVGLICFQHAHIIHIYAPLSCMP